MRKRREESADTGEESKFKGRKIPKAVERERHAEMQERTKERNVRGRDCVTAAQKTTG